MTAVSAAGGRTLYIRALPSHLLDVAVGTYQPGMRLITPNFEAGRRLQRFLGAGVPVITLTQWAKRLLAQDGWTPLKPYEAVDHLQDAIEGISWNYLGPIIERPATLQHLLKLLGELQRAKIFPEELEQVATAGRESDVAQAYAAYHAHCLATRRYDANGTEFFAGKLTALQPSAALIHGYAYLDSAQLHLLGRLLGPGSVVTLQDLPLTAVRHHQTRLQLLSMGFEVAP